MFKEIKDFFTNAANRASNPFISSFFLSWIVINYNITLALFNKLKYEEQIRIIQQQLSDWHLSILYPLIYSISYALLIPLTDVLYTYFEATISNLKELMVLRSKKIRPYSTNDAKRMFTELQDEIKEKESENINTYTQFTNEILKLKLQLAQTQEKLNIYSALYFLREEENPFDTLNDKKKILFLNHEMKNEITIKIDYEACIKSLQIKHPILIECLNKIHNLQNNTSNGDIDLSTEIEYIGKESDYTERLTITYIFDLLVTLKILNKRKNADNNYYVGNIELLKKCLTYAEQT